MAVCDEAPLTLPVTSLKVAAPFYLSILQPLGYHIVSQARHKTTFSSSVAVGLGPKNSARVHLFLSQSDSNPGPARGKPVQVIFPATSRAAVRQTYVSALDAGARVIAPPADRADGVFNAIFADIDSNQVETVFDPSEYNSLAQGLTSTSNHQSKTVADWREGETLSKPSSVSSADVNRAKHPANAVVGTLIGAAAGAALTYAVFKSKDDSRCKEEEEGKTMLSEEIAKIKAEARAHADRGIALIDSAGAEVRHRHSEPQHPHRNSLAERDSGYYSSESARDNIDPKMIRHGTWPISSGRAEPSRSSRKRIEYATPSAASKAHHATKQWTEVSTKYSVNTITPPSPPLPYSMERGASQTIRPSTIASRHTASSERSQALTPPSQRGSQPGNREDMEIQSVGTMKARSKFERSPSSKAPSKTSSRRYSIVTSKAPSKSQTKASTKAPSNAALSRASYSTNHTARRVPLPASQASTTLSAYELPQPPSDVDKCALDDLETVVPDDSISCAPSPPRSPAPKRSYASSKQSSKGDRPGSRNRRAELVY